MRRIRFLLLPVVLVLVVLALAYAARAPLAGYVAEGWLASNGIPSSVHVDTIDFGHMEAHVALGEGLVPDFIGRISAQFDWHGLTPSVRTVRVANPHILARFDGRTFSIGALGKLIDALKSPAPARPSTMDASIDNAVIHVVAQQGNIDIAGNAQVAQGKLASFDATAKAGRLTVNGTRLFLSRFALHGRGDGETLALQGNVAGAITRPGLSANQVSIRFAAPAMRLKQSAAGYGVSGMVNGRAAIGTLTIALNRGAARVTAIRIPFSGGVNGEALDLRASIAGSAQMDARAAQSLAGRIPVFGADASDVRALTAALTNVNITVPAIHISYDAGVTRLFSDQPVVAKAASGAVLRVENTASVMTAGTTQLSGALALTGGGLPEIALDLASLHGTQAAMDADFRLHAKFSAQPYRGVELSARGELHTHDGDYRIALDECAHVALAAYLSNNRPLLEVLSGNICPAGRELLRGNARGWTLTANWNAAAGKIKSSRTRFARGAGTVMLARGAGGLDSGRVTVSAIAIGDDAKSPRFARLKASGAITLMDQNWSGAITLSAKGHKLGTVTVHHAMRTGAGGADIALHATFADKGLQPADLSPLLSGVSQASGSADFHGKVAWNNHAMTSGGTLVVTHLDCLAPVGPLQGTNAKIAFTSLAPLKTPPGETITIGKIGWVVPATDIDLRLALSGTRLSLESLKASIAKGSASLDPSVVDLSQPFRIASVVRLKNVDLDALVQATNLSDRIKLEVRASGRIPFSIGPEGIRLNEGILASDAPGYLSIKRSLWSSGTSVETTDAIRDFAYQAMEHLALDSLDGVLTSLPQGRLGLKLHIKGRNAPKEKQPPTTVNLIDLLQGSAFNKPMPLPKDTPVDLTLDTSLNFDELLRAYGQLRNGASHR